MNFSNKDGLIDQIYMLLWIKKNSLIKEGLFPVNIPDTIITQENKIIYWKIKILIIRYFTSKKDEMVL